MTRRKVVGDGIENGDDSHWHISRGVPLALIISLLGFFLTQTGTIAWFAARLDSRVDVLEKAQAVTGNQGERLTRVEEKLISVQSGISDIKGLLTAQSQDSRERAKR